VTWQPDYTTLQRAKDYLRIADTTDDVQIGAWITAASRAADDVCNRQFGQATGVAARVYRRTPYYDASTGFWTLEIDDVMDTTGLLVNGGAYASSGCTLLPDNAPLEGQALHPVGLHLSAVSVGAWRAAGQHDHDEGWVDGRSVSGRVSRVAAVGPLEQPARLAARHLRIT
jgi:hypothetical protein